MNLILHILQLLHLGRIYLLFKLNLFKYELNKNNPVNNSY